MFNNSTVELANSIRKSALEMVHRAKASHIGSALSIADIVAVLYGRILSFDSKKPMWDGRDRFILSKGHACVAIYAALEKCGFIDYKALLSYGQDNSVLMNHISHKVPGVDFSTGALGHGLPVAAGKAFTAKKLHKKWKSYVLLSDGELDEGSNWEAMMFASHNHLDNLVAIVDYNKLQSLTTVEKTLGLEPLADKLAAFGWAVHDLDGHNHDLLYHALKSTPWSLGKPSIIIAHTIKGKGVNFMENSVEWHYRTPTKEQLEQAVSGLDDA